MRNLLRKKICKQKCYMLYFQVINNFPDHQFVTRFWQVWDNTELVPHEEGSKVYLKLNFKLHIYFAVQKINHELEPIADCLQQVCSNLTPSPAKGFISFGNIQLKQEIMVLLTATFGFVSDFVIPPYHQLKSSELGNKSNVVRKLDKRLKNTRIHYNHHMYS